MTDMGSLNYFLGISVTWDSSVMFLSQYKYATEILEKAHMVGCNSSRTPVDTESKLGDDGDLLSDPTLYRSLAVPFSILLLHAMIFLMRSSRYARGTLDHGLQLFSSTTTSLVAYSDADWVGCPATWISTSEAEYRGVANVLDKSYLVAAGQVRVLHVPSRYQYADIFTKSLPSALFEEFHTSLSVCCPPAPSPREC
ncbi:ribonuclease H-like domain-containing protein [Tanacetum coccineum]